MLVHFYEKITNSKDLILLFKELFLFLQYKTVKNQTTSARHLFANN
jgi:hypothetical protein